MGRRLDVARIRQEDQSAVCLVVRLQRQRVGMKQGIAGVEELVAACGLGALRRGVAHPLAQRRVQPRPRGEQVSGRVKNGDSVKMIPVDHPLN